MATHNTYRFGDALKAFNLRHAAQNDLHDATQLAKGSNVPWNAYQDDLGNLPTSTDSAATRA